MSDVLGRSLTLPCGLVLKNRLVKSPMSDSLGDGTGLPTLAQIRLYQRWADGGAALAMIGEAQIDHAFPEKPGNLVLSRQAESERFAELAAAGSSNGAHIWPQLGHAGALAHPPISAPAGPSALDLDGLQCGELTTAEVEALPEGFAAAAAHAVDAGFSGVQVHAGHGFLLSQFLSPLFNNRTDGWGGSIEARTRLILEIIRATREAVGPATAVGLRINSSDQLDGGLTEKDSLAAIELIGAEKVDLIDISGGTYFPGAPSSSDRRSSGPYFVEFAARAKEATNVPLMVTGGFKTRTEAEAALSSGACDMVGLARTMVLDPELPTTWLTADGGDPQFPSFDSPPPGGITAWYTMRLTAIADHTDDDFGPSLNEAIATYDARDEERCALWNAHF
jgi:2,4-dienoyl-CoA reductase-like NADH-dependent reductase (Old Yellow Enzyme family)